MGSSSSKKPIGSIVIEANTFLQDIQSSTPEKKQHNSMPLFYQCKKGDVVSATSDFKARHREEVSCYEGNRMIVLCARVPHRVKVKLCTTGKVGYIPTNYVTYIESLASYDWYFGAMPRSDAEALLSTKSSGAFLLRDSNSKPGKLVLSVRDHFYLPKGVRHYLVYSDWKFSLWSQFPFFSLRDMVEFCKVQCTNLPILLTNPCTGGISERQRIEEAQLRKEWKPLLINFGLQFNGMFCKVRQSIKNFMITPETDRNLQNFHNVRSQISSEYARCRTRREYSPLLRASPELDDHA